MNNTTPTTPTLTEQHHLFTAFLQLPNDVQTKLFHDIRDVGDGKMRGMMNQTKMLMLHSGAIRQVGGRQLALEDCLRGLVEANPTLEGGTEALALLEAN